MGNNDVVLKRYYHNVKRALPCSCAMKRQIVQQLQESVRSYLEQNPGATFAAVQQHFGTPQDIASSYIYDQDAPELLQKLTIRKRVLAIIAGVLAAALLIWVSAVMWAIVDENDRKNGYYQLIVEED